MLRRHSSRRTPLDQSVLNERLHGAVAYDRIAGYFRSSLFEVAGEALLQVQGKVRVVCNADIDPQDMATAALAQAALRENWCAGKPELSPPEAMPRYQALYEALTSEKLEVRVLPDAAFGLIHGKAGVLRYADGSATSFLGSVNESTSAWKLNYELLWEDDSAEAVAWVQEEFDALWNDSRAVDLANCPFITQDIRRIVKRQVVDLAEWRKERESAQAAASAAVEIPIYRREQGLWPHQKYFVQLALERHRLGGARLILADQVGLGKTLQLAMAALVMAVDDPQGGPVLIIAPKPLLSQWQEEMNDLLQVPSSYWDGRRWIDEHGITHPAGGLAAFKRCPRRIGLISQGIVVSGSAEIRNYLLSRHYTCVIVDEAHRTRRRKVPSIGASDAEVDERAEPNNLMKFLRQLGPQTKSMLLATATPVQLHPLEAWDLLHTLSHGNDGVLGGWSRSSPWFRASECLAIATGLKPVPTEPASGWEYVRDPLPAAGESEITEWIRRRLGAPDCQWQFPPENLKKLPIAIQRVQLQNGLLPDYGSRFNPLLRCIIRRTRRYLEDTINPVTGSYYLPKVTVKLFGEDEEGAIPLRGYSLEAYEEAEHFATLLQQRIRGAGFFKTLLLRRLGSSMEAGRRTIQKLLATQETARTVGELENTEEESELELYEESTEPELTNETEEALLTPEVHGEFKDFTEAELASLRRCLDFLSQGYQEDPKLQTVLSYLLDGKADGGSPWSQRGCILFSQYYDTVFWMGRELAKRSEFAAIDIGLYAGSKRSGLWRNGRFERCERDWLKARVRSGDLRILLGTDAASEGLNMQRLGSLINIDLPWNPTRLEQRKGRIQRIGQVHEEVWIANLRYRDSVEDRVHKVLAERLEAIHDLFGQIPDTLEDVWVELALHNEEVARHLIDRSAAVRNPFDEKYSKVEDSNWESCPLVLNPVEVRELLSKGWSESH